MPKILIFIILFMNLLIARDDPFTPLVEPTDSIRPYYGETSVFDKAQIELPNNARLIKQIEVTYQNVDGSIESKSISVSGKIDWRTPITISQQKIKNATNVDSTLSAKDYSIDNNSIFIRYDGKLIRNFAMQNPHRIVLDFEKNLAQFKQQKIILNKPYFTMIRYGLHNDFIRIVVEMDGNYVYNISRKENGVVIDVK